MSRTLRSLYICYLSLEDPLVHTQVVAYLEGLAARGHEIHLLTYDSELSAEQRRAWRADLERRGIAWHSLRYHKRPSLPATVYDALAGAALAVRLVRRHRLEAIHARNHVPAAAALIARRLTRSRLIFDLRGLMAEEYVDAGRWREGGIPFRLTKRVERAAINRASGMVMLTERVRELLFGSEASEAREVIPCCADLKRLDSGRGERGTMRKELGIGDRPVLAYVGKFGGWYLDAEMVEFFATARESMPGLFFLVITQAERSDVAARLARRGIPEADYRVIRVEPERLGPYLAAADFGICFIRRCPSKVSSSPTKVGEYLGAGLPVVSGRGIGDVDDLLGGGDAGVLVDEFSPDGYRRATDAILGLLANPATAERCRVLARRRLSLDLVGIPRYDYLYRLIAEEKD
jgi:glycosyltransferase involved in cell wall biosynthesis